ncbi:MAG: hypothetical protein ACYCZX_11295 [Rhodospirillaceae bacterium]
MKYALAVFLLWPAAAQAAESVPLSVADCQRLVRHQPRADVEYKPGVDVHGKAVVPADLGGGYQMQLPETIDIQIGIDLADRLALRDSRRAQGNKRSNPRGQGVQRKVMPFSGTAPLGMLSVRGNDLYWNDEPLAPQDEALLASACTQGLNKAGIPLPTEKPTPPK